MSYPLGSGKSCSLSDSPFYSVRTLSVAQCFITKGVDKSLYTLRPDVSHAREIPVLVSACANAFFFSPRLGGNEGIGTWEGEEEIRGEI